MHRLLATSILSFVALAKVEWMSSTSEEPIVGLRMLAEYTNGDLSTCRWRKDGLLNIFNYKITSSNEGSDSSTCYTNPFKKCGVLPFPYPQSSYSYDLEAPHSMSTASPSDKVIVPNIQLNVDAKYLKDAIVSEESMQFHYDFEKFERNGDDLLYGTIPQVPGVYSFNLIASDFEKSTSCSSCFSVTDTFRPVSTKEGFCGQSAEKPNYNKGQVEDLKTELDGIKSFRGQVRNNGCSQDRCDDLGLTRTPFLNEVQSREQGQITTPNVIPSDWDSCIDSPLSDVEWKRFSSKIYHDDETKSNICSRTCKYDIKLKEYYTPFECNNDGSSTAGVRMCEGSDTAPCEYSQSINLQPMDFVSTVSMTLQESSLPIPNPNDVFPGKGYKSPSSSSRELHFDARCHQDNSKYSSFCDLKVKISTLFQFSSTLKNDDTIANLFKTRIQNNDATAIVFWRYKTSAHGQWNDITTDEITLTTSKSKLIFEAHTACGKVTEITWNVFVHRTKKINPENWWPNLLTCDSLTCNVPKTDFGVCTFKFDPLDTSLLEMLPPNAIDDTNKCKCTTGHCNAPDKICRNCNAYLGNSGTGDTYSCMNGYTFKKCMDLKKKAIDDKSTNGYYWCGQSHEESLIEWKFDGFQCDWKYKDSSTAAFWLDTKSIPAQHKIEKSFAIKMLNALDTVATLSCTLHFKSKTEYDYQLQMTKDVHIKNCDKPTWFSNVPTFDREFIKDTCINAWNANLAREPAPFHACHGAMIFPSIPGIPSQTNTISTIYLDVDKDNRLKCCNPKDNEKPKDFKQFECKDYSASIGVCSNSKTDSYIDKSLISTLIQVSTQKYVFAVAGLTVSGLLLFVALRQKRVIHEDTIEDGYTPLLG